MRIILCFICFIFCMQSFAQTFTKITTGEIVTSPSASRSANFVDVNNDGWDDIFISNGPSSGQNNMLYLNNQDGTFLTVSGDPIVQDNSKSDGASFADVDNDGDLDACVVTWHNQINYFYRNQGNGQFDHEASNVIGAGGTYSETASWGDYDKDGWVDLYITNSGGIKNNKLFKNDGSGDFQLVTSVPPVAESDFSRSVDWIDYDLDGDQDIFVTNENNSKNSLYQNDGTGNFTKITGFTVVESLKNSAGSSWGDIDNDGDFDLFVANWENQNNQLFFNDGNGVFTPVMQGEIVNDGGCSFGSSFADVDNDGDLDLFVCNAFCTGENNFFYLNQGDGTFVKETSSAPATDQGWTFGCAWGDYDNNGFMDLVLANCKNENQSNALYKNNGNDNHWFKLSCEGIESNRSAIGTVVKVKALIDGNEIWQMRRIAGQSGYCSQNSLNIHFGLGDAILIDSLVVQWPSGTVQTMENIAIDNFCSIIEGGQINCSITATNNELKKNKASNLKIFPNPVLTNSISIENPFINRSGESILKLYSQNGSLLKTRKIDNSHFFIELDVIGLSKGIYQVVLEMNEKKCLEKLIVQ
jgi:enediyne biosynthesis protein E4